MSNQLLLIPYIQIHNANALSSPYTVGFPAMTAWLGAVHALQRKLNEQGNRVSFEAVGVVSHYFDLQTYKGPGDFEYSIIGTANPVDKDGKRPSFIEEARCHLQVSLVIQCNHLDKTDELQTIEDITRILNSQLKMAGGDIVCFGEPSFYRDFTLLKHRLMPGYALLERRDLMIEAMEQGQDAIDALLDFLAIHHSCETIDNNGETQINWRSNRKPTGRDGQRGWIVPIATGFQGISDLGLAKNQRDDDTPHRFAEAVITLGEFKMAYRLQRPDELLWHYHYEQEHNLYLCQQENLPTKDLLAIDVF